MKNSKISSLTKEDMLAMKQEWLEREVIEENGDRLAWLNEGIELHKKFLKNKVLDLTKKTELRLGLADLYLESGYNEKVRLVNFSNAFKYLTNAARFDPENPVPYYRLAFLMENLEINQRKWEAIGFYAKESLEKGIEDVMRIKLLALLGMAYGKLNFKTQSEKCFKEAYQMEEYTEYKSAIDRYALEAKKTKDLYVLTDSYSFTEFINTQDYDDYFEQAEDGKCYLVDMTTTDYSFVGDKDTQKLDYKEAELLAFLIEQNGPCSKEKIEAYIWEDRNVSGSTVKKYISKIRRKISDSVKEPDMGKELLRTSTDGNYYWTSPIPIYVIRT